MKLKPYQEKKVYESLQILLKHNWVYLAMQMRTGKTPVSLTLAKIINAKNVFFITKKKAIEGIYKTYLQLNYNFSIFNVVNYEQLQTLPKNIIPDVIIIDEAHNFKAFPKASDRQKKLKELINKNINSKIIFCSGTPMPETASDIFHQMDLINIFKPFGKIYSNFYKWAHDFVKITKKRIGAGREINDYSNADRNKIMSFIGDKFVYCTHEEAGFENKTNDNLHYVNAPDNINNYIYNWLSDQMIILDNNTKIAATKVSLLQGSHQLIGGTLKIEKSAISDMDAMINVDDKHYLSNYKIDYIKQHFTGKIAIFYNYIAEGKMLEQAYSNFTRNNDEFNNSDDKIFISQIKSGSEGVDLSTATDLIFYSWGYSYTTYAQARERLQHIKRTDCVTVHFICGVTNINEKRFSIDEDIYKRLQNKHNYTNKMFSNKVAELLA